MIVLRIYAYLRYYFTDFVDITFPHDNAANANLKYTPLTYRSQKPHVFWYALTRRPPKSLFHSTCSNPNHRCRLAHRHSLPPLVPTHRWHSGPSCRRWVCRRSPALSLPVACVAAPALHHQIGSFDHHYHGILVCWILV